jgi:hypothetical protein
LSTSFRHLDRSDTSTLVISNLIGDPAGFPLEFMLNLIQYGNDKKKEDVILNLIQDPQLKIPGQARNDEEERTARGAWR